ncbi:MAG TPA: BrnT family toxin [Candidatus Binatia bacterium]|nr:BrnT family toxin [Candidatus Binatia bacterium]
MKFIWEARKAGRNLRKHGVAFEEAATIFLDPLSITGSDPDHSMGEDRYVTFGVSNRGRFLAVAHTEEEDTIRLISARVGTARERAFHEEG